MSEHIFWINSPHLAQASTGNPCSSSDLPSPHRWGRQCPRRSDTSCGSSASMDTLKLKQDLCPNPFCEFGCDTCIVWGLLTFSVVTLYLRCHSFLAVHPVQPFFLWCWSLVYVLSETVHVLRAPGHVASFTDHRPPRCLLLFTWAQAQLHTSHRDGNMLLWVGLLPWAKLWVCCPLWRHWCQYCSLGSQQMKRCHTTVRSWV